METFPKLGTEKQNPKQQKHAFAVKTNVLQHKINTNNSSAPAKMGNHARAKWAQKWAAAVHLSMGGWVPIEHNVAWDEAYFCTQWHLDPSSCFGYNRHGPKIGGCAPFGGSWLPI